MWHRGGGTTNAELVNYLKLSGVLKSKRPIKTMLAIDRDDFSTRDPYEDAPQQIGCNATISAPHMHAHALEGLKEFLVPGAKVLDVGSGSGYLTACFGLMVEPDGKAVGIEHIDQLVKDSRRNIAKNHKDLLDNGVVELIVGDGRLGHPVDGGYNAIHLIDQMARGGRMLIPVGREHGAQVFLQVDKTMDGKITQKIVEHVMYVPLTSPENQIGTSRHGRSLVNY
ncbi:unnamed protein product, partial [Mesorhabditis belari]|uniref:protein-L-isoaspartate(D-aspartate) O-methyltransferase n=1 Tax=Mesorhabditis belari TaxID=2138241 RepID=A0AAF3FQC1_9BILA